MQSHKDLLLSATIVVLACNSSLSLAAEQLVRASAAGARLDSHLLKGGGTDDTKVLQGLFDRAATGRHTHVIIDGVALVSGLNVYGNTTIECLAGAGLYLKDRSNRAIIRNAHRTKADRSDNAVKDEHITLRGCFLNGNRQGQVGKPGRFLSVQEDDGSWIMGMQFFGVNDLNIENVTVWGSKTWGMYFVNATNIDIRNVTVDHGMESSEVHMKDSGTDGLHFGGDVHHVRINGGTFRTGDDALSFVTDEGATEEGVGPYVRSGPITNIFAQNISVKDAECAVRLISGKDRLDKVVIDNISGTINGVRAVSISHWTLREAGNIGSILLSNINVDRSDKSAPLNTEMIEAIRKIDDKPLLVEFNYGEYPLINANAHIEYLSLQNVVTKAKDDRPILTIGPQANIKSMRVDLNIEDPQLRSVPLRLEPGSAVERLDLSVDWKGESIDQIKNPIDNRGGSIARLNWIDTPPQYVSAELKDASTVVVQFSQNVKATDFKAGVSVKRNGQPLRISGTRYQKEQPNEVRYTLETSIRPGSALTWAYDNSSGTIRNWSGSDLLSVSDKKVVVD